MTQPSCQRSGICPEALFEEECLSDQLAVDAALFTSVWKLLSMAHLSKNAVAICNCHRTMVALADGGGFY